MSGTHLYYAGVLLRDCEVKQWKQDIVKDDSGTDVLYSKVTISVESTLISLLNQRYVGSALHGDSAHQSTIAVPFLSQETLVDRWQEIEWRLQQHRQDFWLAMNGLTYKANPSPLKPASTGVNNDSYRVVLAATGLSPADLAKMNGIGWSGIKDVDIGKLEGFNDFGSGKPEVDILRNKVIDLNNGPKPLNVSVVKIIGGQSLRVSLTIEVCRCFCKPAGPFNPDNPNPPVDTDPSPALGADKAYGVISNKWSMTETMDSDWNSEHSIHGKLIVSDARYKPHAMRLMAIPKMAPYFRLESREFSTDPAGLILSYAFRMKETGPAPIPGVVRWRGSYVEKAGPGGHKSADITIRVTGQTNPVKALPNSPSPMQEHKQYLVNAAYRIAQSRVRWSIRFNAIPGNNPQSVTLMNMIVSEQMDASEIELRLSVLYQDKDAADKPVFDNFGLRLKNMGASMKILIPAYDPRWWPIPGDFPWDTGGASNLQFTGDGTFYDNYFQVPCSLWHASLEAPKPPNSQLRAIPPQPSNSQFAPITLDPNLQSNDPLDQAPGVVINNSLVGWSDAQVGFSYLQCDIDTKHRMHSGNVHLPVSKARYPSGDTSLVVNLFPGISQRVLTMVATRIGDWPQVPSPKALITHGGIKETYIDGSTVSDTPKLTRDGKTLVYSLQVQWIYALSRLPSVANDKLLSASDPRIKTTPDGNAIKMSDYFTDGVVEIA